eukprot:3074804-Amphidinium_carterae.1
MMVLEVVDHSIRLFASMTYLNSNSNLQEQVHMECLHCDKKWHLASLHCESNATLNAQRTYDV